MFRHILVPVDSSERSELALPFAAKIASQDSKITLLYVVEVPLYPFFISPSPPALPQETEDYAIARQRHIEKAEAYLKRLQSSLAHPSVETQIITGRDPAEHILDFSNKQAVDVIVIATRGHSGITRWIMGSVTQKVLQAASCPVLAIPSH